MEKLNELAKQAKEMSQLHGPEWSSALCESGVGDSGKKHHAIISDSKNDFVIDTGSESNEASWLCDYLELCSPENIIAIAEAFRALEQRASNLNDGWLNAISERDEARAKLAELEKQKLSAEVKLYRQKNIIPEGLNRSTAELVLDFAKALAEKLHRSEQKYGWSDGWKESDWQDKCLADFHHHIGKGDPRDVAAYCAFMWHHEWPTRPAPAADLAELVPDENDNPQGFTDWYEHHFATQQYKGASHVTDCENAWRAASLRKIEGANK